MGIRYCIDRNKGVTFVAWDGTVTSDEFFAQAQRLVDDPDWPPPRRLQLADLRTAPVRHSLDDAALGRVAEFLGDHLDKIRNLKLAVVADDAFKKAVLFERIMSAYPLSIIVFADVEIACIWLGIAAGEAESALRQLRGRLRH